MSSETGRTALEKECYDSWVQMELDFARDILFAQIMALQHDNISATELLPIYYLINSTRGQDYSYSIRAGQSMRRLQLSRSRTHHLHDDQPYVLVNPMHEGTVEMLYRAGETSDMVEQVSVDMADGDYSGLILPFHTLLDRLMQHPID